MLGNHKGAHKYGEKRKWFSEAQRHGRRTYRWSIELSKHSLQTAPSSLANTQIFIPLLYPTAIPRVSSIHTHSNTMIPNGRAHHPDTAPLLRETAWRITPAHTSVISQRPMRQRRPYTHSRGHNQHSCHANTDLALFEHVLDCLFTGAVVVARILGVLHKPILVDKLLQLLPRAIVVMHAVLLPWPRRPRRVWRGENWRHRISQYAAVLGKDTQNERQVPNEWRTDGRGPAQYGRKKETGASLASTSVAFADRPSAKGERMILRETLKPNLSGLSANTRLMSVLLPTPEGPKKTTILLGCSVAGAMAAKSLTLAAHGMDAHV